MICISNNLASWNFSSPVQMSLHLKAWSKHHTSLNLKITKCSWVLGHPLEWTQPTRGHTLKENEFLFPQKPSTVHSSSAKGGVQEHLPLHAGSCASLCGYCSCSEFLRARISPVQKMLLRTSLPELLDLTVF